MSPYINVKSGSAARKQMFDFVFDALSVYAAFAGIDVPESWWCFAAHVRTVEALPRPKRDTWWRDTKLGKGLNWSRRGKCLDMVKWVAFMQLEKHKSEHPAALLAVKAAQIKRVSNPHKD
jgi:hypothetical protein